MQRVVDPCVSAQAHLSSKSSDLTAAQNTLQQHDIAKQQLQSLYDAHTAQLRKAREHSNDIIQHLQSELAQALSEDQVHKTKLTDALAESQHLKSQLAAAQSDGQLLQTTLADAKSDNQQLHFQLSDAQSEAKVQMTKLSDALSEGQQLQHQMADAQATEQLLQTELTDAQSKVQQLQVHLADAQAELQQETSTCASQASQLAAWQAELAESQSATKVKQVSYFARLNRHSCVRVCCLSSSALGLTSHAAVGMCMLRLF